ncbi:Helitron helicase-like protein [Phytophthora palmivora]|uniref:Helitron helicase-like protein n=1 Tax=Phytophthora palmivora TaxID=4796 RepID=A0A2P4Y2F9_9STRA|nr:Helitron helicase-like protein [Phytophthora palmivora]
MVIENAAEEPAEDEDIIPGVIPKGMARLIDYMYTDVNKPEVATDEYFANKTILMTTTRWYTVSTQQWQIVCPVKLTNMRGQTL